MKANELMIGDWVHVEAHRGFNAQNVKVETIPDNDGNNEYGHHYGHIGAWLEGGDNDFRDVEARHLHPIPLTEEILNSNFPDVRDGVFWFWNDIISSENVNWFELRIEIGLDEGLTRNIRYVHELQHALRLCGIEKEVVL